jgi:hypothetical protein
MKQCHIEIIDITTTTTTSTTTISTTKQCGTESTTIVLATIVLANMPMRVVLDMIWCMVRMDWHGLEFAWTCVS